MAYILIKCWVDSCDHLTPRFKYIVYSFCVLNQYQNFKKYELMTSQCTMWEIQTTVRSLLSDFMVFNDIKWVAGTNIMNSWREVCFSMLLKSKKSDSEPLTVIPCTLWCGVYLSAEFLFLERFDIRCIVFKLHPYLVIQLLDLTFSFRIILVCLHEIHAWHNYKPSSHIY